MRLACLSTKDKMANTQNQHKTLDRLMTASEARDRVYHGGIAKILRMRGEIFYQINASIESGSSVCIFFRDIPNSIVQELQTLGYAVKCNRRDGETIYNVRW